MPKFVVKQTVMRESRFYHASRITCHAGWDDYFFGTALLEDAQVKRSAHFFGVG